jgi:protease-4
VAVRRGVVFVILLILAAVVVSAAAMFTVALFVEPPPAVPARATLSLPIEAPFDEIEPSDVLRQFLHRAPTLRTTIDAIARAKADARIQALVIRPSVGSALWGQVQEIHDAIEDFKSSKKPVIAYLEAGGMADYYLASAADRVVMMPGGQLDVAGLASYELFFRGALDKIGVYPDLLHIGDYKTASNTFTEKGFTAAHHEMTASLNHDWYEAIVESVARDRKLSADAARTALGGGPYLADDAHRAGLVDELAYDDQIDDAAPVQGTSAIDAETYERAIDAEGPPADTGGRIALLYAVGTIASGKSSFDSPSGTVLGSDTFGEWLRKVRVDPAIRAVVVRIDSPGGSAIASEAIWRQMKLTRDVKPLIVSMGDVAASGGYYIAAPAQVIVADPGTLTGSIGVVTGKFVVQGALDKIGVGTGGASDGAFADIYSPFRPFSPAERAKVEEQMQTTYERFLSRVAEGRREPAEKVDAVAQGRVWTGRQARGIGLVDEIGGLDRAIAIAKDRAKLDPSKGVRLVVYPPKRSFYDLLSNPFNMSLSARLGLGLVPAEARAVDSAASIFQLFRRGEPLAIMPNIFVR